jgi:hypothetical protein
MVPRAIRRWALGRVQDAARIILGDEDNAEAVNALNANRLPQQQTPTETTLTAR